MNETKAPASAEFGAAIKQRRLLRGQSIETAHQHTRIPKKFLEALEEGRTDVFPAPVYLRGFLKDYCEYLDLEFEPLWLQLSPAQDAEKPEPESASERSRPFLLPLSESTWLPFLLGVGLFLSGVLLWIFKSGKTPEATPNATPPATSVQAPAPRAAAPPAGASSDAAAAPQGPRLKLQAVQATWVRVQADDRVLFEGRLPAGAQQEWPAKSGFRLRCADPQALRLTLNGSETALAQFQKDSEGTYTLR